MSSERKTTIWQAACLVMGVLSVLAGADSSPWLAAVVVIQVIRERTP